jgi:hypothetical protein
MRTNKAAAEQGMVLKGPALELFPPFGYAAGVAVPGTDLPDPAGIPVAGRAKQDMGVQAAEIEC